MSSIIVASRAQNPADRAAVAAAKPAAKPADRIIAAPVNTKTAAAATKPVNGKADSKDAKPADPNAKKEDLQLAAGLNHLKGLPITATAAASVAK
jgi:hypothetical protein